MSTIIQRIAGRGRVAVVIAAAISNAMLSVHVAAQPVQDGDQVEKLVDYAQCIRENGYPDFPDPAPGEGFKVRIEPGQAPKFQAAQAACKNKLPSGFMQGMEAATPEELEVQLAFAGCMRDKGVANFPDPSPQGGFDINDPNLDPRTPQVQNAMEACREANPRVRLMIRKFR